MIHEWVHPHARSLQVHDIGDRLAQVCSLLGGRGFRVEAEEQEAGPDGNWMVRAVRRPATSPGSMPPVGPLP